MKSPRTDREDQQRDADRTPKSLGRRALLRLAGAGTTLSVVGGTVAGQEDDGSGGSGGSGGGGDRPAEIHPAFGYPGLQDEEIPPSLEPDYTVELRTFEPVEEVQGDFVFDPVGLAVDPGSIVAFDGTSPEHTVTAYHNAQGRWQRVPEDVPPFSSPVIAGGGFWLYRFDEPGVYDVFCGPHEFFGMVMRLVVGERAEWTINRNEEGRPPFGSSLAVFEQPELEPDAIAEEGTVAWDDLDVETSDEADEGTSE